MNIRCPVCSSKLIKKYEECSSVYEEYIYECPDCKLFLENTVCGNTYIEIGPFTVQYNYNTEPKKVDEINYCINELGKIINNARKEFDKVIVEYKNFMEDENNDP